MKTTLLIALSLTLTSTTFAADPEKDPVNKKVDAAVKKALGYLAKTQRTDGSWGIRGGAGNPAITGLSVMAFLSAGHVPGEGPYAKTIEKGIRAVMKFQAANGLIADNSGHEMYHHGICSIMLAEVVGMTQGKLATEVRKRVEKAVKIILTAQRQNSSSYHYGGWRYRVSGSDSDISVTGWQVMALRAARNIGCDVPPKRIEMAVNYIKRCQDKSTGSFRYSPRGHRTIPCTGTSILALELCGKQHHLSPEVKKAGAYLLRYPIKWSYRTSHNYFYYSLYYCSQAMFQLGMNYWKVFRKQMHDALLNNQSSTGAWVRTWGSDSRFGPNYGTAMCVLALTVEYRFLPIYQRGNESIKKE